MDATARKKTVPSPPIIFIPYIAGVDHRYFSHSSSLAVSSQEFKLQTQTMICLGSFSQPYSWMVNSKKIRLHLEHSKIKTQVSTAKFCEPGENALVSLKYN